MTPAAEPAEHAGTEDERLVQLRRDYEVAFLRYLPRHEETGLAAAYELGRKALTDGVSVLDLVRIHHEVLTDMLARTSSAPLGPVVEAAAAFLAEVLASTDMAQRQLREG